MLSQSSQVLPAGLYEAKLHGDTAFFRSLASQAKPSTGLAGPRASLVSGRR